MSWTRAKDLKAQVGRLWERGLVLQSVLAEKTSFPKRLFLKGPSSSDLTHAFPEVRTWCDELSQMNHIRFVFREVNHRVTGTNSYPIEAWIDSAEDAVALLGLRKDWDRFLSLVDITRQRQPVLLEWIWKRPLAALANCAEWERYLDLVDWMIRHPNPGCYIRQVDLPGIHTKFIEAHRGLLMELFDRVLPTEVVLSSSSGVNGFCARYGFRDKPERIRFRVLDPARDPLLMDRRSDITIDVDSLAMLKSPPANIFITENETNFLAFPDFVDSWIFFGAGYGFAPWKSVRWLQDCHIYYWGDIDTHGFAVLDELRGLFPSARSFLMDSTTFMAHKHFCVQEPSPCTRSLGRLTEVEGGLYRDLQENRLGHQLRLEQERIAFNHLKEALSHIGNGFA